MSHPDPSARAITVEMFAFTTPEDQQIFIEDVQQRWPDVEFAISRDTTAKKPYLVAIRMEAT